MTGTPHTSQLILNINGLKAPIKRQRIENLAKKTKTQPYVAYKRLISLTKNKPWLRVKGWKKVSPKQMDSLNRQE
jgi:hypothetical protein